LKLTSNFSNRSLRRIDDAAVIQFLSQIGAVLVDQGILDRSDIEEFRIFAHQANATTSGVNDPEPPLFKIATHSLNLTSAVTEHFGTVGLARNIWRYSVRETGKQLSAVIKQLIQMTVEQSTLLFNRPFALYLDQQCDRLTLFSTPLIEIGEACESALRIIEIASKQIARLIPSSFPSDTINRSEVDQRISEALGFEMDIAPGNSFAAESLSADLIVVAVRHIAKSAASFAEQLRWNLQSDNTGRLRIACEFLTNQSINQVPALEAGSTDLGTWEHKRLRTIENLHQLVRGIEDICLTMHECLNVKTNIRAPEHAVLARNVGRMVSADLMRSGVSATRAQQASRDLLEYCRKQNIRPSQVISGELSKINAALNKSALETLQSTDQNPNLLLSGSNEKSANYKAMERLKALLGSSLAIIITTALLFSAGIVSCGFKTDPKSQLEDPRPQIPFRAISPEPEPQRTSK
jgi:hypothetical protein